jgi:hypothetical protein
MPKLGLGAGIGRAIVHTPGIVTDSLVMKHMYPAGAVQPLSDGACYFAGNKDHILLNGGTSDLTFSIHDANHSFAFWAKRNATDTLHAVFGQTPTGAQHIRFTTDGKMEIESDTGGNNASGTFHTNDTQWHHYAVVISGGNGTVSMYQDGGSITMTDGDAMTNDITFRYIGAQGTNGTDREMNGYLCNIGIWSGALTSAQVKSIMWKQYADLTDDDKDAGGTESSNLVSWWNLDVDANDSHGSNNGTLDE